jgi:branched-chain amino acid transport system ATP-binding protein
MVSNDISILETQGVSISFGGVQAVNRVSIRVTAGERRVVIGPNGAGKSTLFNLIGGQLRPQQGSVRLFGADVSSYPDWRRARLGLMRTFQISRLFRAMTVWDNAMIAAYGCHGLSLQSLRPADSDTVLTNEVTGLLDDWDLLGLSQYTVQNIGHGHQRLLEIALAFASYPKVVLLDEPTAGLSEGDRDMVTRRLSRLPRELTLILTDHDMDVVFNLADRITVLNYGEVLAEGDPETIRKDERVRDVYFGQV